MYFPNAFRKSFLPVAASSVTLTSASSPATAPVSVLPISTSVTGIAVGNVITGTGIPANTTVVLISSLNITLSNPLTASLASGATVVVNGTSFTTSAAVNAPNVLTFGSTTGVVVGMSATSANIPAGAIVTAVTSTTVTLSAAVTTSTSSASVIFASSVALASSGTTAALTAGQLGFFDAKTYSALGTVAQQAPFIIAQGSYFAQDKIGPVHGGYQESVKSKVINPKFVSRLIKVGSKAAVNQVVKVSVNAGVTPDTTYRLRLDLKGSPALRFLNHQLYRTMDAYTGCANTTNPTYVRDAVSTLLLWKDQINSYPTIKDMVQARVYKKVVSTLTAATTNITSITPNATTGATALVYVTSSATSIAVGQKVTFGTSTTFAPQLLASGAAFPVNAFVTNVSGTTITITYPTPAVQPALTDFNPAVSLNYYSDVYSTSGVVAYIPGTQSETGVGAGLVKNLGVATGLTSTTYVPDADAASITTDAHIELTVAYIETKFGTCTFTPTDKYDLEPLIIYTSVVDESGDPCLVSAFVANVAGTDGTVPSTNLPYLSSHGDEVQTPVQAFGVGETVLRELILDGRYLQNAYPDSGRVESFRMREIEADPALATVSRTALYDRIMILHNVPRFYNPTGTFDNDQYLVVIHVPKGTSTTAISNFILASCAASGNGAVTLETFN